MTPNTYTEWTEGLSIYQADGVVDERVADLLYLAVALNEEAGEVAGKVKKFYRDGNIEPRAVAYELGDVLFYLVRTAKFFGYTLQDVIDMNVQKLEDRQLRNVVHGAGDNR